MEHNCTNYGGAEYCSQCRLDAQAENVKLRALLDKVGMDRAGTAGTLMGAEQEVRTLQLQLTEARESCAKIAEGWKVTDPTNTIGPLWVMGFNDACQEIANQIRSASILPKRHNPHDHAYGICNSATCEECKSLKRNDEVARMIAEERRSNAEVRCDCGVPGCNKLYDHRRGGNNFGA